MKNVALVKQPQANIERKGKEIPGPVLCNYIYLD